VPLLLAGMFYATSVQRIQERLPRSRARCVRLFWGAIALALAAWGADDPPDPPDGVRAALDAACTTLSASRRRDPSEATAVVRAALAEALAARPAPEPGPLRPLLTWSDESPPVDRLVAGPDIPEASAAVRRLREAEPDWLSAIDALDRGPLARIS
jgi:hypothetical protein